MPEDKDLYPKSKAPAGEMPEAPIPEVDSVVFYSYVAWNDKKSRFDINGFAQVELWTDGSAEVVTIEPPEFEEFLERHVYDVEDPYLKIVSPYSVFNQMLAAHWRQLPRMFNSDYGKFIETDEEGLDEMIKLYGWLPDEKPDERQKE